MYVNIEFLDEEPLENVITSLHYHMDKTIFIGFHDDVEAYKKRTTFFLEKYCHVKEIKFIEVPENDLQAIIDAISEQVKSEQDAGNKVFFDITGGEGLILMAFGMVAKDYGLPIHQFDVVEDKMKEFRLKNEKLLSEYDIARENKLKLTLDSYICMWGAQINRTPEANVDKLPIHNKDYMKIMEEVMKVLNIYGTEWNKYTACIGKELKVEDLYVNIVVNPDDMYNWDKFPTFLKRLSSAGAICGYDEDAIKSNRVKFRYQSLDMKRTLLKSGNTFEIKVYQAKKKCEGVLDCDVSVKIDWDGNIDNGGVYNEVDVLALKGNILTFVSCKGGNMEGNASLDPMYQLDTIASRFGGKYARKILATRTVIDSVYADRAAAMKIKLENY